MSAERTWLWGAEGGDRYAYAYLGHSAPLTAAGNYQRRLWLDWIEYRYDSAGHEVTATAPGIEALLGRRLPGAAGRVLNVFGGLSYRNTSLSPADVSAEVSGRQLGVKLQLDGAVVDHTRRFEGIASFIAGPDAYWMRGRAFFAPVSVRHYGVELVLLGDPDFDAYQLGILLGDRFRGDDGLWLIKAGVRRTSGQVTGFYAGFEAQLMQW